MARVDLGKITGLSAYEIAKKNGFVGTEEEWLESLDGSKYDDTELKNDIAQIEDKIPTQATATNQLADKDFVNSSIATNTAYFIGTFNSLEELQNTDKVITINDYAFVIEENSNGEDVYGRYKYDGSEWIFEYNLNNSSFTSEQWKAINSGVTAEWKESIDISPYTKSVYIKKIDGTTDAQYFLIATLPDMNINSNTDSLYIHGSDYKNRFFEATVISRDNVKMYNYGKDTIPIIAYVQSSGDVNIYWKVSDAYNRVVLNLSGTKNVKLYNGELESIPLKGTYTPYTDYNYKHIPYLLRNFNVGYDSGSRPTNANDLALQDADNKGGMRKDLATSSMTTGKPPADAHLLTFFWDGNDAYNSQMAIRCNTSAEVWVRGQNTSGWGEWKQLATQAELEEVKKNSEELLDENEELAAEVESLNSTISSKNSTISSLNSSLSSMTSDRDSWKSKYENHTCDHSNCVSADFHGSGKCVSSSTYNELANKHNTLVSEHNTLVDAYDETYDAYVKAVNDYNSMVASRDYWKSAHDDAMASRNEKIQQYLDLLDEYNAFKAKHTSSSC